MEYRHFDKTFFFEEVGGLSLSMCKSTWMWINDLFVVAASCALRHQEDQAVSEIAEQKQRNMHLVKQNQELHKTIDAWPVRYIQIL